MAAVMFGTKGTRQNRMFEGIWVNTVVLIRPNAGRNPDCQQGGNAAWMLALKKILPSAGECHPFSLSDTAAMDRVWSWM